MVVILIDSGHLRFMCRSSFCRDVVLPNARRLVSSGCKCRIAEADLHAAPAAVCVLLAMSTKLLAAWQHTISIAMTDFLLLLYGVRTRMKAIS